MYPHPSGNMIFATLFYLFLWQRIMEIFYAYSPTELLHYLFAGTAMMAMMSYRGDNTGYDEL